MYFTQQKKSWLHFSWATIDTWLCKMHHNQLVEYAIGNVSAPSTHSFVTSDIVQSLYLSGFFSAMECLHLRGLLQSSSNLQCLQMGDGSDWRWSRERSHRIVHQKRGLCLLHSLWHGGRTCSQAALQQYC